MTAHDRDRHRLQRARSLRGLAGVGMRVAVIERSAFGGTCVKTGCIPTTTMVAAGAYAAHMAARATEYGEEAGSVRIDMKRATRVIA